MMLQPFTAHCSGLTRSGPAGFRECLNVYIGAYVGPKGLAEWAAAQFEGTKAYSRAVALAATSGVGTPPADAAGAASCAQVAHVAWGCQGQLLGRTALPLVVEKHLRPALQYALRCCGCRHLHNQVWWGTAAAAAAAVAADGSVVAAVANLNMNHAAPPLAEGAQLVANAVQGLPSLLQDTAEAQLPAVLAVKAAGLLLLLSILPPVAHQAVVLLLLSLLALPAVPSHPVVRERRAVARKAVKLV